MGVLGPRRSSTGENHITSRFELYIKGAIGAVSIAQLDGDCIMPGMRGLWLRYL